VTTGWVLVLSVLAGIVNAVDVPTRQALMAEMVGDREDLPNAIALNSSAFNASRLVGPALGGVLVASVGEGVVFLLNALSYVVVLGALVAVRMAPRARPAADRAVLRDLRDGLAYALRSPGLRSVLLLSATVSVVGLPFTVFLPVVATDVLHGGPRLLGVLSGCVGLGSTVAALRLAHRADVQRLDRVIRGGGALLGVSLLALGGARHAGLAATAAFLAGLGLTSARAASNTALQTLLDEHMRGRVMSLYAVAFLGMAPLGSLAGGALAERVGVPLAIAAGGFLTLFATAWFARRLPRFEAAAAAGDPGL
jgi:MFS family permease